MLALTYLLGLTLLCGAVCSVGGLIEHVAPLAPTVRRLLRRRGAIRRRNLAPPDGAIVRRGIDRLRSALLSTWRATGAPWRWLCAHAAERRLREVAAPEPRLSTWSVIDYSEKRARALEQLGDEYLLARPVNRLERRDA